MHDDTFQRLYKVTRHITPTPQPKRVRFKLGSDVIPKAFAASAATKEEVEMGEKQRGNTKPIETAKRIWRPQVTSEYKEPDCIPDPTSDLEVLYKDYGKPLWTNKSVLPPRDDVIKFIPTKHNCELKRNLQWRDTPSEYKIQIENLIKEYWDVFAEEGVRKNIRGALFHVDTGETKPVCCKPPRYGPHESRVIDELVAKLEKNGLVEDDDGPWGALIVLAAKPNQEHVHWSQYVWRLCVSYRQLNAVTRPFTFPIVRCDDAVKAIGDAMFYITMDLDSGYWQIKVEASSKAKLAFFTPTGKKRFTVMPMGATNAHPVFVALVSKFKKEWDNLAKELGLKHYGSQVIVDDIMLYAHDSDILVKYFACVLKVLQHYRCTAKLRKCRFFPPIAEFVGLDVHADGNSPAESKFDAFRKLSQPVLFTDLNMLIGCFGFYQEHLPLYEIRIGRWRNHQKLRPLPGTPKEEEMRILREAWTSTDDDLLQDLKDAILSKPILRRPNSNLRFYLKTDWSKKAQAAALLQPASEDAEALEAMLREAAGGKCEFDLTKSGLRLFPIAFISRRTTTIEESYHSYVGEACAGVWAIEKFRPWLFGREFTWLTDCSGLKKFFLGEDIPTHMIQRWRMQLLRYDFTIVHRPGRMMFECDLLSRYNTWTQKWRDDEQKTTGQPTTSTPTSERPTATVSTKLSIIKPPVPIAFSNVRPKYTNGKQRRAFSFRAPTHPAGKPTVCSTQVGNARIRTDEDPYITDVVESHCDEARSIWIIGARLNLVEMAMDDIGIDPFNVTSVEDDPDWGQRYDSLTWEQAIHAADDCQQAPDWLIVTNAQDETMYRENIEGVLEILIWKGLSAVLVFHNVVTSPNPRESRKRWQQWLNSNVKELNWDTVAFEIKNCNVGGAVDSAFSVQIMSTTPTIACIATEKRSSQIDGPYNLERACPLSEALDKYNEISEQIITPLDEQHVQSDLSHSPSKSCVIGKVQVQPDLWVPTFSINHPSPDSADESICLANGKFLIQLSDSTRGTITRSVQWTEMARAAGHSDKDIEWFVEQQWNPTEIMLEIKKQPQLQTLRAIFALLSVCEERNQPKFKQQQNALYGPYCNDSIKVLTGNVNPNKSSPQSNPDQVTINRWTTIPLPTHKQWADATSEDPDLHQICEALTNDTPLQRHQLAKKAYFEAWDKGQLTLDEGILFFTEEPKTIDVRQLLRRVVPRTLRHVVITAFHATPLAGHSGIHKTYWRIAVRYWWPGMYSLIRDTVSSCAHCKLSNAASHQAQQILQALSCDGPFDVVALDVWSPGNVTNKYGDTKLLTCCCTMTGFAGGDVLQTTTSEELSMRCFSAFFIPNGLPRLVIIDAGSENKGPLISMCTNMGIAFHVVSPEDHNGILCERFHRYLNKVEKIQAADTQSFTQFVQGVMFACYAWNAAPIDGTNITRSFAAKSRHFPFPIQIKEDPNPLRTPPGQGEAAVQHLETTFPLWAKQSMLLQILNEERRERHRELKNNSRNQKTFGIGDLVIVRKQVKSDAKEGIPSKLVLAKYKGPYRVIDKIGDRSYMLQKLPVFQGQGKPHKPRKYAGALMEKIPSTVIVNKRISSVDTRLAALEKPLVHNPLEQSLGFYQYGRYVQAPPDSDFAFDRVEDLWNIDLSIDDSDDEAEIETAEGSSLVKEDTQPDSGQLPSMTEIARAKVPDTTKKQPNSHSLCKKKRKANQDPPTKTRESSRLRRANTYDSFYNQVKNSKDKLFIIARHVGDRPKKDWFIVQVDWDETVEEDAKTKGIYHCRWYMRYYFDAPKRPVSQCRFTPEIHELLPNDVLGAMRVMKLSDKIEDKLKKTKCVWYQQKVSLFAEHIVGPFDFVTINKELHRISPSVWNQLRMYANTTQVDLLNLDRVEPLDSWRRSG